MEYKTLSLDKFINSIQKNENFSYCKLNHAFWEASLVRNKWWKRISFRPKPAYHPSGWYRLHGKEIHDEILELLKDWANAINNTLYIGVSAQSHPNDKMKEERPVYHQINNYIESIFPSSFPLYDGLFWKRTALESKLNYFVNSLRNKRVVVIGLKHMRLLEEKFHESSFSHIEIDLNATRNRKELLSKILSDSLSFPNSTYLFQAGETLSTYLILKLHSKTNASLIDVGRSIDALLPDRKISSNNLNLIPDFYDQEWLKYYTKDRNHSH